ncbi:hypothetical protein CIHG_06282 [Coccidioides immitis H538.4]|uniref:Uncharacterized protein n=2 Tax=Coccidioides immitis TaxID=5501 RepID=A0A0J8RUK3_COCIT|nr:hypothetical protein CIRG_09563 [Coccidioides immitis RMSCC 2394]KMU88482.1 hypothetical protein CIHG_06282 [Coccidioides immitis H538.4]
MSIPSFRDTSRGRVHPTLEPASPTTTLGPRPPPDLSGSLVTLIRRFKSGSSISTKVSATSARSKPERNLGFNLSGLSSGLSGLDLVEMAQIKRLKGAGSYRGLAALTVEASVRIANLMDGVLEARDGRRSLPRIVDLRKFDSKVTADRNLGGGRRQVSGRRRADARLFPSFGMLQNRKDREQGSLWNPKAAGERKALRSLVILLLEALARATRSGGGKIDFLTNWHHGTIFKSPFSVGGIFPAHNGDQKECNGGNGNHNQRTIMSELERCEEAQKEKVDENQPEGSSCEKKASQ